MFLSAQFHSDSSTSIALLQNTESLRLIAMTQQGMDYYHNYDRLVLSLHIALGFLGWIFLIVCHLLRVSLSDDW